MLRIINIIYYTLLVKVRLMPFPTKFSSFQKIIYRLIYKVNFKFDLLNLNWQNDDTKNYRIVTNVSRIHKNCHVASTQLCKFSFVFNLRYWLFKIWFRQAASMDFSLPIHLLHNCFLLDQWSFPSTQVAFMLHIQQMILQRFESFLSNFKYKYYIHRRHHSLCSLEGLSC